MTPSPDQEPAEDQCRTPGLCTCPGKSRCPRCGYTNHDAAHLMDHQLCDGTIPDKVGDSATDQPPPVLNLPELRRVAASSLVEFDRCDIGVGGGIPGSQMVRDYIDLTRPSAVLALIDQLGAATAEVSRLTRALDYDTSAAEARADDAESRLAQAEEALRASVDVMAMLLTPDMRVSAGQVYFQIVQAEVGARRALSPSNPDTTEAQP